MTRHNQAEAFPPSTAAPSKRSHLRNNDALTSRAAPSFLRSYALPFAVIFVAVIAAYQPLWRAGFVWNDSDYVTRADLQTVAGLARIWTDIGATEQYYPVLHSAFWFEHHIWGDAALGYHLINVFFHASAACVLALIVRRLELPGAWLAAVLFALHPIAVESVAWIAEQKNTLSTLLYLLSLLSYLGFSETRRRRDYALALGFFLCALLSKSATAPMPAAVLIIAWWKHGRLRWREDIAPLIPFFLSGALIGLFTAWVEKAILHAEGDAFLLSPLQRTLLAARIVWFYLGNFAWPANPSFIYPRWTIVAGDPLAWLYLVGLIALAAGTWIARHRTRAPASALAFFVLTAFPVLGFLNVYGFNFSFVADHWQYLPNLGLIVFVAAGIARLGLKIMLTAAAVIVPTLGALTWQQSTAYESVERLYRTTLVKNPTSFMVTLNLSSVLLEEGHAEEGIAFARKAVAMRPDYAPAYYQLGTALAREGHLDEAIPLLRTAIRLRPAFAEAQGNLGVALTLNGHPDQALPYLRNALRLNPSFTPAARALATIQMQNAAPLK